MVVPKVGEIYCKVSFKWKSDLSYIRDLFKDTSLTLFTLWPPEK